ncbi:MAG: VTT domain-containing protein [Rhodospirillales bacterium]|nr:VTT domain-containing protein [Rhodospirillales bacterium]
MVSLLLTLTAAGAALADGETLFETARANRRLLTLWAEHHAALAACAYVALYLVGVMAALPGAVWMTIVGGFIFGTLAGSLYTVIGATTGATALFLAARWMGGEALRCRAGPWLAPLEQGFRRDGFHYLVALRILPLFPFWLVNLVPALTGMRLGRYLAATVLGLVPGAVLFSSLGASLAHMIERGGRPDTQALMDSLLWPLVGLAALALVPVLWRRLGRRNG